MRIIGAYHFARPEQNDAISEAKYFVSILQNNQTDLMPVLDLESPTDPSNSNLTGNAISNWARSFINYETGYWKRCNVIYRSLVY